MDVSYQLYPVNFPSESSSLPSPAIELTLFGYVCWSNQRRYSQCHVSLRRSVYEFLGIINLKSSAILFTFAHIAIKMARRTRTVYTGKRNKGWSSSFHQPDDGRCVQRPKRCDKHGNKDEGNSSKNVNNVHSTSSQKYRQILKSFVN